MFVRSCLISVRSVVQLYPGPWKNPLLDSLQEGLEAFVGAE